MTGSLATLRTLLIRGLAVVAVVFTYTVSSIGTIGIAGLGLTATSTQAQAWWYRGGYRGYRRGYWGGYRRGYYRRRWW
jgi:hypothetical protein